MRIAYCIDREETGGGCEYVRRKCAAANSGDVTAVFYSERGECRAAKIDDWGADVIVVNHLKALVQLLGRPFRRPKGRVRFVMHGIHLRKYGWKIREALRRGGLGRMAALPPWAAGLARRTLEAWLYRRCDEIVALTETDRRDILRLYGRHLPVVVEPNTLDGWVPHLEDGLPSGAAGRFDFVCIARFNYQKGQDRWIAKVADGALHGNAPTGEGGMRTLFIGDGDMLADCRKMAAARGVGDRCVFVGAIPEAERYLKCAEAVVSPSRWEGMPYLLMKARVLGCRILATDCPGNRDVLAGYDRWTRLDFSDMV